MKKNIFYAVLTALLLFSTATQAFDESKDPVGDFFGGYLGGRIGTNYTYANGAINVPGEGTIAYIVQAGYIQGGFNKKFGKTSVGVGGYADMHGYETHSNGVFYGGHAFGVDTKLGLPVGEWFPYVKLGYGYSAGAADLRDVKQYGFNQAMGLEYKFDPDWSMLVEYKINNFSKNSTKIVNNTIMFGFNYFLEKVVVVESAPVEDLTAEPAPERAPDIAPELAPPP